jgi:hypothetical protein
MRVFADYGRQRRRAQPSGDGSRPSGSSVDEPGARSYHRGVAEPHEQAPKRVFRAMRRASNGQPACGSGACQLGVRPGTDIPVDADGFARPQSGGLSVTPTDIRYLPPHVRPIRFPGGRGKLPVFGLYTTHLRAPLSFRLDPGNPERHAFVEPDSVMLLRDYQTALCATAVRWQEESP